MITTSDMVFDSNRKRFRLSNDYVYNELGTDLANALIDEFDTNLSTIADRTLKRTSDQLYNFLRAYGVTFGERGTAYDTACYLIATNTEWYYAFRDALAEQLFYFIQGGDVSVTSGLNIEKGTRVEKSIRDTISDGAFSIMNSIGMFHTILRDIPEEW